MKKWTIRWWSLMLLGVLAFSSMGYCHGWNEGRLQVFIKDEGFKEKNIVKPRIYVVNCGYFTVHDFDLFYDFKAEPGKTPVLERYYLPGCTAELIRRDRLNYSVIYHIRNANVKPGDAFPSKDGCAIGIHYQDWSEFCKWNDYSNPASSSWHPTYRVEVNVLGRPGPRHDDWDCEDDY